MYQATSPFFKNNFRFFTCAKLVVMLAHSNAPKAPDSISAIWFVTGVKEVKTIKNLITKTNIIQIINIYIFFHLVVCDEAPQFFINNKDIIYFHAICLPYNGIVTSMPTRLSLQINKQTNKHERTIVFRSKMADGMVLIIYLSIYNNNIFIIIICLVYLCT